MFFLIVIIAAGIGLIIWSAKNNKEEEAAHQARVESEDEIHRIIRENEEETKKWREEFKAQFGVDPLPDSDDSYEDWCKEHAADIDGYSIAGINFRHLDHSHTGPFEGTVKVEPDNPHDSHAVAIFRGRKKVGYIPRDFNEEVFYELLKNGGQAPCSGYIHTFLDEEYQEKFAGKIIIGPFQSIADERDAADNAGL